MTPHRIKAGYSADGIVVRRYWPSHEDAYRVSTSGEWSRYHDPAGPWVDVDLRLVPGDVLAAARHFKERHSNE